MSETIINPAMIFDASEITVPEIERTSVEVLVETEFDGEVTITAYKIHKIVNAVFELEGIEKRVPPQMMYNYSRNGMINKVKGCKAYTKDEVIKFVERYTNKFVK